MEVDRSKTIRELFKLQSNENKVEIIKEYELAIRGFSNIEVHNINSNSEMYIVSEASNKQNIEKIQKYIKSKLKIEDDFSNLLDKDLIIERYGDDFTKLVTIFEKDQYGNLSDYIINKLIEKHNNTNVQKDALSKGKEKLNSSEQEDKLKKLRKIISDLETTVSEKDKKIKSLLFERKTLNSKIEELENLYYQSKKSWQIMKASLDEEERVNSELNKKNNELNMQIAELKSEKNRIIHQYAEASTKYQFHLMGIPQFWIDDHKNSKVYLPTEVDNFIDEFHKKPRDIFIVFKSGIALYDFRRLKKLRGMKFVSSFEEFKDIKGDFL